ncbi:MAG: SDR family oxidoreductase [Candidatus Kapabacteria bacterium]|nr:SDR family oxidoreductase [Ignavibacteriota bacterium]MCW5886030.1 SDR family oxidoreductase [Candidatus Kapabacteria bacterium]
MRALITGATSGIGYDMALQLAEQGINLVLASRNEDKMIGLKNELSSKVEVDYFVSDLSKEKSAKKLYNEVCSKYPEIDILINNSGYGLFGKNNDFDPDMLEEMIILNAASLTSLSRLFGNDMSKRGKGYILNVASTAAFQPIPYFAAYSASKTYVRNFSKSLHHELKNNGVSVTCLHPGPTSTNFFEVALKGEKFKLFEGKPMMTSKEVARIGINAMFERRVTVTSGISNQLISFFLPLIPLAIVERVLRNYIKG